MRGSIRDDRQMPPECARRRLFRGSRRPAVRAGSLLNRTGSLAVVLAAVVAAGTMVGVVTDTDGGAGARPLRVICRGAGVNGAPPALRGVLPGKA